MISVIISRRIRFRLGLHDLANALVGIAGLRTILALSAAGMPAEVSFATSAAQWILCAGSLILIAVSESHVRESYPGITSLFRGFSYGAIAGSLLPTAAGPIFFPGLCTAPPFIAELSGLATVGSSFRMAAIAA